MTDFEEMPIDETDLRNDGTLDGQNDKMQYEKHHYLLFGADDDIAYTNTFDCDAALKYLESAGISTNGFLTQARKLKRVSEKYAGFHDPAERYCDFCGRPLTGAEYKHLKDGRDQCSECSKTVVRGQANLEALFHQVRENLIEQYSIDLPSSMSVKVVSAKRLAKEAGGQFVPTKYFDARAIGLAYKKHGKYGVMFENGSPRLSLIATTAHELTHIWQYTHWDEGEIARRYGEMTLAVYEGMAKWAEIQYVYLINEAAQAKRILENEVARTDVYGYGLRMFLNEYPLSEGIVLDGKTPFDDPSTPY